MKKRILSILLTLCMVLMLVPTTAFADFTQTVYVVAGHSELCGKTWDGDPTTSSNNIMTDTDDGTYQKVYTDVAVRDGYQFKVVENHVVNGQTWHGIDGRNENFTFNVKSVCDVTITFDPATLKITVTGTGVEIPTELNVQSMRATGNGDGNWLNNERWEPAVDANLMTEVSSGVYEITYTDIDQYDNYQVKFAANGSWADNWGGVYQGSGVESDAEYNSNNNITIGVPYERADVTLRLDLTDFDYVTKQGAKFTVTVVDKTSTSSESTEQFNLTPGGTYWFDLSGENIPGTVNSSVPDTTLHYVPFTYAGTVDAYKLTSAMATTEEYAEQNKYPHSLFVADYAVKHTVSWNELNTAGLIFGRSYTSGSVDYTLRAPSGGSGRTGSGDAERGAPQSNEWDVVLDKNSGYIKNWNGIDSWGQDTDSSSSASRVRRGYLSARSWNYHYATYQRSYVGFRPVLEVLSTDALGSDGLKAVTLDLNGGKLGGSTDNIQIIVKNGAALTAPASDGLTRSDGDTGDYFKWLGSDGKLYASGDSVPAGVTTLTAQWTPDTYTITYDGGEGIEGSIPADTKTHGVPVTLSSDTFIWDGFVQTGWVDKETGAIYDLGATYDEDRDATLYPYWEKLITVTAPFTTTVALGDAGEPGETTFMLGLIDGTGNELTYDDQYFFAEITTDGAGSYSGEVTITATAKWLYDMLYEGAFIWQYDGEEEGWTYDDTVWGVRLYMPEIAARFVSEPEYSLLIYPTYVMDNGLFNLDLDAGPVDEMTFTNTYTKNTTLPEDEEPTEIPNTGDSSNLALWFALLAVSAAGVIGMVVYSRRKGNCKTK